MEVTCNLEQHKRAAASERKLIEGHGRTSTDSIGSIIRTTPMGRNATEMDNE